MACNVDLTAHGHDESHEANLRQAVDYIDRNYTFTGYQQYQTQRRAWPRLTTLYVDGWPIDADTIPQDIKDAQAELAYLIHEGLDPTATVTTGAVKRTRSKAGPVEAETEYASSRETPRLVAIEGLLRPYIGGAGPGQFRLVRG